MDTDSVHKWHISRTLCASANCFGSIAGRISYSLRQLSDRHEKENKGAERRRSSRDQDFKQRVTLTVRNEKRWRVGGDEGL